MPRLRPGANPIYRKHKASGQAVVTLSGQAFYCGPHGTKASVAAYDRYVMEWLARGRLPQPRDGGETIELLIFQLIRRYLKAAEVHYRKNGHVTKEVSAIKSAVKFLWKLYGREPVGEFGPLKLKAVREQMIAAGWTRKSINKQCHRICRMFSWGVENEVVPAAVAAALREVKGLARGRSEARESPPVTAVADRIIKVTLPHLPPIVAAMVRFQRFTGCRPEEVCFLRPADVDRSGDVWLYTPRSHKMEHHDRPRTICIGPKAQAVLKPYLLRDAEAYCFSPAEGEKRRREEAHARRITPLEQGNQRLPGRAAGRAGDHYTVDTYRRAIRRACEVAFGMPQEFAERFRPEGEETPEARAKREQEAKAWRETNVWAPNQLRHSAATEFRKKAGAEASRVALGHAHLSTTEIYAEKDLDAAIRLARAVG